MSEEKVVEYAEKSAEEVAEQVEEVQADTVEAAKGVKSKLQIAREKIEKAKALTLETREQIEACMQHIEEDTRALEQIKQEIHTHALKDAEALFETIGVESEKLETVAKDQISLIDPGEGEIEIKELSSGRFRGLFWAFIAMIIVFAVWCYAAVSALGLPLVLEKFPDIQRLTQTLEWTSQKLGQGANASVGAAVVIAVVLIIGWLVYMLLVSMKHTHNLRLADETEEAVALYCTDKDDCKAKMKIVREHIQNSSKTLAKYKVLLEEQNAKLQRALFIEETEGYASLHAKTKEEIATTQTLISELKSLLETPISEAGVLTTEAIETLKRTNKTVNDHIMKLYS